MIAALPTPNETERQRDYWDDVLRGFGVRVSYGGRRAFVVRYRVTSRRRTWRDAAQQMLAK